MNLKEYVTSTIFISITSKNTMTIIWNSWLETELPTFDSVIPNIAALVWPTIPLCSSVFNRRLFTLLWRKCEPRLSKGSNLLSLPWRYWVGPEFTLISPNSDIKKLWNFKHFFRIKQNLFNTKQPKSTCISALLITFVILITSILKNSELGQHFRPLLFNLWGEQLLKQRK